MNNFPYPPVGFRFNLKIIESAVLDKLLSLAKLKKPVKLSNIDASFKEVSGITVEIPTEEVREGGENRFAYHLPNPPRYTPLVLKRGLILKESIFANWIRIITETGFSLPIVPLELQLSLIGEDGKELMAWVFVGSYPTKWDVAGFDSMNNQILVETLEITYNRFTSIPLT